MKKVYLVRHGETTYNQQELVQDGETQLTEQGQKQALRVAERLQQLDFAHLVVSDYRRTKQTAEPVIKSTGLEPVYSDLFREVRRPSEFFHTSRHTEEYQSFMKAERENFAANPNWHFSDEENFVDASNRAQKAFSFLLELEGDVAVITHGHFMRHMAAQIVSGFTLDGPLWQKMNSAFLASNTGIAVLEYFEDTAHWRIVTWNDHAHFAE